MDKNKNKIGFRKAYTLIELIIVLAITVLLFSIGLGGLLTGQKQFNFQANNERTLQLVRDARSLALNGKAFPDYTDYDRDGKTTEVGELMTPANVGVNFDTTAGTITMFADLHNGLIDSTQHEGVYDAPSDPITFYNYVAGKDVAIEQYTIGPTFTLLLSGGATTIFFSPIFGDIKFDPSPLTGKFFIFGVKEKSGTRKGCAKIHPVAGVPELATVTECS